MRLLVIGNPENRRVSLFKAACARLSLPGPKILPWEDVLTNEEALQNALVNCDGLRIESPGEHSRVEALLVTRGGGTPFPESDYLSGRIGNQRPWFSGWTRILRQIEASIPVAFPMMNAPGEIRFMFDKSRCQKRLSDAGIPTPEMIGETNDAADVFRLMEEHQANRVFVKPKHSSSASGVVALQTNGDRIVATTSARNEGGVLYNSLRMSRYETWEEVIDLLNLLGPQGLFIERWFPKLTLGKRVLDFRVLVIAGRARHVVARTSRSSITNLHLGNARGDLDFIKKEIGNEVWLKAMATCEKAASCFPNCLYVAADLMVSSSSKSVAVAEVNAFGDLIPNLLSEGQDPYEAELAAWRDVRN